jgi:xanthine dehydrogenase accessory factor
VVVAPFAEAGRHIPDGPGTHVIIMTPAHTADEIVLRQIVARPVGYVGMMASPAKAAALLGRLQADGVAAEALSRVHAPVGLPIGSQTAAEIAVSIAAELIHHRRLKEGVVHG